jgi:hypothetical protein
MHLHLIRVHPRNPRFNSSSRLAGLSASPTMDAHGVAE